MDRGYPGGWRLRAPRRTACSGGTVHARPAPADGRGTVTGVPARDLSDEALERELGHLHETRHDTFLHGSEDALAFHTARTPELRRSTCGATPTGSPDARRTRIGNRELSGQEPD